MKTQYYGDVRVAWSEKEWEELQKIKQKHFDDPNWSPPTRRATVRQTKSLSVSISESLYDKIYHFAQEKNASVSAVLRDFIVVLTSE